MKKMLVVIILIFLIILFNSSAVLAKTRRIQEPNDYLTFSFFVNPASIGYKHHLFNNVYATGNLDYRSSISDLEFQAGTAYLLPPKIFIFKLYGGGGFQFSRNEGYQYPYVTVGTNFLIFYSEIIHPMKSRLEPKYRFGFSIKF